VLHSYSKAYIKRELNHCKGETQQISIKGRGVLHYLLFALYMMPASFYFFTFLLFHLFNLSPLSRGMYLSADGVKRLKSAFGNKSIGAMGITFYPELA